MENDVARRTKPVRRISMAVRPMPFSPYATPRGGGACNWIRRGTLPATSAAWVLKYRPLSLCCASSGAAMSNALCFKQRPNTICRAASDEIFHKQTVRESR
jgi:hypothetical protein